MVSKNYKEYLKSDHWQKTRRRKLNRTAKCAICAERNDLDVHHLTYDRMYKEHLSDLRVVCRRCHEVIHVLINCGKLKYKSTKPQARYAVTKSAVKKHLKISKNNMFMPLPERYE